MAEFHPVHPLGDLDQLIADHSSSDAASAGITLTVRADVSCAQLFASNGRHDDLAKTLKIGVSPAQVSQLDNLSVFPIAPGQWMISGSAPADAMVSDLRNKVDGLGYVSQQGDSRVCIRVSGPAARDLMARGCRLDLHESVAGAGFCAQTNMAQIGVLVHQIDDAPCYDLYVYSGFSRSFFDWLTHTAAQFGMRVE